MFERLEKTLNRKFYEWLDNKFFRTKKLYLWKFALEDRDYTIELYNSVISGKKKIT